MHFHIATAAKKYVLQCYQKHLISKRKISRNIVSSDAKARDMSFTLHFELKRKLICKSIWNKVKQEAQGYKYQLIIKNKNMLAIQGNGLMTQFIFHTGEEAKRLITFSFTVLSLKRS